MTSLTGLHCGSRLSYLFISRNPANTTNERGWHCPDEFLTIWSLPFPVHGHVLWVFSRTRVFNWNMFLWRTQNLPNLLVHSLQDVDISCCKRKGFVTIVCPIWSLGYVWRSQVEAFCTIQLFWMQQFWQYLAVLSIWRNDFASRAKCLRADASISLTRKQQGEDMFYSNKKRDIFI